MIAKEGIDPSIAECHQKLFYCYVPLAKIKVFGLLLSPWLTYSQVLGHLSNTGYGFHVME